MHTFKKLTAIEQNIGMVHYTRIICLVFHWQMIKKNKQQELNKIVFFK